MRGRQLLIASLALNFVLAAVAIGWTAWIVQQPHRWIPSAYNTQSDVQGQVDDLSSRLDDLETGSGDQAGSSVDDLSSSVDDLSSRIDDLETGTGDQASSSLDDVATTVSSFCDAFSTSDSGALQDVYLSSC